MMQMRFISLHYMLSFFHTSNHCEQSIALFFPIVILAVPFIDTLFAMIRRVKKGQHIMQADKSHLIANKVSMNGTARITIGKNNAIIVIFLNPSKERNPMINYNAS
jgi:UDP-N-acetylmuramyl pentapeptide phosphotransferase/UDP-N-acetylglucosamine-1-phosphate transferase